MKCNTKHVAAMTVAIPELSVVSLQEFGIFVHLVNSCIFLQPEFGHGNPKTQEGAASCITCICQGHGGVIQVIPELISVEIYAPTGLL